MGIKKGKIITHVQVERLGYKGVGITSLPNGKKILIKGGAIPGSDVDIQVMRKKRDYLEARLIHTHHIPKNILTTTPVCPHYGNGCGGCTWQSVEYRQQLQRKQQIVQDSFRGERLQGLPINEILKTPQSYHYRNKIEFSFGKFMQRKQDDGDMTQDQRGDHEGKFLINQQWNIGFHKQGEFSKIIDVDQCFLISQQAHELFIYLKNILKASGLPVYDQKTHQGFFRHLVIREGVHTEQFLINVGVSSHHLDNVPDDAIRREELQRTLQSDNFLKTHITTLCITMNDDIADIVKGKGSQTKPLRGDGVIYEQLIFTYKRQAEDKQVKYVIEDGAMKETNLSKNIPDSVQREEKVEVHFRISPFSFFQTNTLGAEILFSTAMKLLGEVQGTVLDVYCGAGSIGLSLLQQGMGDTLVGIDIVQSSIEDAKSNAKMNNCADRAFFFADKAENIVRNDEFKTKYLQNLGIVIVDPPRDGLHKHVRAFLNQLRQQFHCKLLYISCNPVTFARDTEELLEGGRSPQVIQPVDMFPQTYHIEVVSVFS